MWPNIRVVHFPWEDHFANARNAALDAATGDWCVILDCDETLDPETLPNLRKIIRETSANTLQFDTISAGCETQRHWMIRAHRRIPSIRWVGRVHEALNQDDRAQAEGCKLRYGWSTAHHLDPQRVKRLLLKDVFDAGLRDEKPGTRTCYYLAREFWYSGQHPLALFWFHERVKEMGFRAECADAWLYIARINWATGKPEEAREAALKSLVLAPDCRETLLFLAEMSFPEQAAVWNRFAGVAGNEGVLFKRA
jgi:glycosyltransferase involved in cell wall biosynthesis